MAQASVGLEEPSGPRPLVPSPHMTRAVHRIGSPSEEAYGYARAVLANGLIFVSGTSGWDPHTGHAPEDTAQQFETAMARVAGSLAVFDAGLSDLVRLDIVFRDINEWAGIGPRCAVHIGAASPALFVTEARLPQDWMRVELVAIAALPDPQAS